MQSISKYDAEEIVPLAIISNIEPMVVTMDESTMPASTTTTTTRATATAQPQHSSGTTLSIVGLYHSYGATSQQRQRQRQGQQVDDGDDDDDYSDDNQRQRHQLVEEEEIDDGPLFRDGFFALLFWLHILGLLLLGIWYGGSTPNIPPPPGHDGNTSLLFDWTNVTTWRPYIDQDDENAPTSQDLQLIQEFIWEFRDYIQQGYPVRILQYICLFAAIASYGISYLTTIIMALLSSSNSQGLVKTALCSPLVGAILILCWVISNNDDDGSTFPKSIQVGLAFIFVMLMICYLCVVWKWIPFASVNLSVALCGLNDNCGIYLVALWHSLMAFGFLVAWLIVLVGTMAHLDEFQQERHHDAAMFDVSNNNNSNYINDDDDDAFAKRQQYNDYNSVDDGDATHFFIFVAFLISYFWTHGVLVNVVQVTVAGVMATWCFDASEAFNCCSMAVFGSWSRSWTFSFGSICLGSLFQGIASMLRSIVGQQHGQDYYNPTSSSSCCGCCALLQSCLVECIQSFLGNILDYFSDWAYCFCGIYGYGYLESGRRVFELFTSRGLTALVANNLVQHVLYWTMLFIAIMTGIFTLLFQMYIDGKYSTTIIVDDDDYGEKQQTLSFIYGPLKGGHYWSLGIGFIVGFMVSSVFMSVIRGAVNTVIICFADSPGKLEDNHPTLAHEMSDAWTRCFPKAKNIVRPQYSTAV